MKKTWKLGELFCGPGGFAEGARQAGFQNIWAVDNDADSCISFGNNQEGTVYTMEIKEFTRKEHLEKLKKIDGLLFGFPCNDFSLVGKNRGLEGELGPLYRYACKTLDYLQPKFFVAENVTSIGSTGEKSSNYKNFKTIVADLAKCTKYGYHIFFDNYKFEEYGVPQTRHRVILVGFRNDFFSKNKISYERPKKTHTKPGVARLDKKKPFVTCKEALEKLPKPAEDQEIMQAKTRHDERVVRRLKKTKPGENVWDLGDDEDGLPNVRSARMSHIYKRLDSSKPAYTVTGSGGGGTHVYHFKEDRALTNRERARLQTFDDKYEFYGGKESVRRQIGMAVPVLGARKIMLAVKKALKKNSEFISFHHDGMVKAKSKEIYFAGKESEDGQLKLNFE